MHVERFRRADTSNMDKVPDLTEVGQKVIVQRSLGDYLQFRGLTASEQNQIINPKPQPRDREQENQAAITTTPEDEKSPSKSGSPNKKPTASQQEEEREVARGRLQDARFLSVRAMFHSQRRRLTAHKSDASAGPDNQQMTEHGNPEVWDFEYNRGFPSTRRSRPSKQKKSLQTEQAAKSSTQGKHRDSGFFYHKRAGKIKAGQPRRTDLIPMVLRHRTFPTER